MAEKCPPPGKPVTFYECHPEDHAPAPSVRADFDDFISLATESESQSVDFTVKAVLRMLGWKFAGDGPKAPPFSPKVTALGVAIDVSRLHQGLTLIDNTEKRTAELSETIAAFTDSDWPNVQEGRIEAAGPDAIRLRPSFWSSGQALLSFSNAARIRSWRRTDA